MGILKMSDFQKKIKVLIVDDEQVIANTLAIIMNKSGFCAHSSYSCEDALKRFDKLLPDLVISDVIVGNMNGVEMAMLLRLKRPECKVILFGGQPSSRRLIEEAQAMGFKFDVLMKPIHPSEILAVLQKQLS